MPNAAINYWIDAHRSQPHPQQDNVAHHQPLKLQTEATLQKLLFEITQLQKIVNLGDDFLPNSPNVRDKENRFLQRQACGE